METLQDSSLIDDEGNNEDFGELLNRFTLLYFYSLILHHHHHHHLDEDDDVDSDMEVEDGAIAETDKYLVPIEVQGQIKLLWSHHSEILNVIWGRALTDSNANDNWKVFFIQVIIVL